MGAYLGHYGSTHMHCKHMYNYDNRIVTIMPYTFPYTFEYWLIPNCTRIIALGVVIIVLVFHTARAN